MKKFLKKEALEEIKKFVLKNKNVLTIFIMGILLASITVYISFAYFQSIDKTVIIGGKVGNIADIDVRMYLQNKNDAGEKIEGSYSKVDSIPAKGYILNTDKSYCTNNSSISTVGSKVKIEADQPDLCYIYYDVKEPDLKVVTTYNGTTGVPPVAGATATLTCTGSTSTYNQKYNQIEVTAMNSARSNCTLTYTPISGTSKVFLNQKIISLSGTTQGTGQVVNENGYRYEGKNPNNYVWFNNELWRIIGVFDSASHGKSGENLVKIIRENSLGGLAWHKSNTNDWNASSLKSLLNGAYYNKQDGTESGYCYGYSTSVPSNCDYTSIGIDSSYRSMIKNVTWYLGGYSSTSVTSEAMYGYERGTTVYSGRPTSGEGYIGLMYPSDYGYSVLSSSCARTTNLGSYSNATCAGQSWLYKEGYEWTLSPYSSYPFSVFFLYNNGYLNYNGATYGYGARPVLYLDASVYMMDGNGSRNDPYIIGMG